MANELELGSGLAYAKAYYILGEADNGPTNAPILIRNIKQAQELFGVNDLTKAWNEAYSTMGDEVNIHLVRVNGTPASLTLFAWGETQYEAIRLTSAFSGEKWNGSSAVFTDEYIQISNPEEIGGYEIYYYESYPTQGLLADAINASCDEGDIGIRANALSQFAPTSDIATNYSYMQYEPFYLNGGSDQTQLTKNELHELLDMTYNILEGQIIDIMSVVNVYFDDISPLSHYGDTKYGEKFYVADRDYLEKYINDDPDNFVTFHGQAIDFCKRQMKQGILTHCVMALGPVSKIENLLKVNSFSLKIADATCLNDRYQLVEHENGEIIDNGKYISIVCADVLYKDHHDMAYYNNAYIAYGAYLASNLSSASPTNKVIPNIEHLRYNFDDDEIDYLSKLGVVTLRKSILKQAIVISNGVTASLPDSVFHVVSNVRMVQLILNAYNTVLQVYVGQDVDRLRATQAMDKAIEFITKALISDQVAKDIKPTLTISNAGVALLELDVLCNYSIEYIKATTNIKL